MVNLEIRISQKKCWIIGPILIQPLWVADLLMG